MAIALFPFRKSNHRGNWVLGWNRDAHVYVVRHQVSLYDLAFLLFRQRVENRTQLTTDIPEDGFSPPLGHEYNMVLAVPLRVG